MSWRILSDMHEIRGEKLSDYITRFARYDQHRIGPINSSNIEADIAQLSQEMNELNLERLSFDKWDYITVFTIGLLEAVVDLFVGNPNEGLSKTLSSKDSSAGKWLQDLHEKWDHSGQPLDYQGPHFGGGDHRARTFGHDLLAFPLSLYMLYKGEFIDGYYEAGNFDWVFSALNQKGTAYAAIPLDQAVMCYIVHMAADFFSAKSLPVPGFGLLAHLPDRDIRKAVADMYSEGFNLRHTMVQGIPVVTAEALIRIYAWLRSRNTEASAEAKRFKRDRLLLLTHTVATMLNIGKVAITQNPVTINLPMIIRVMVLAWKVAKEESSLSHRAITKANLAVLRSKCQMLQTFLLLDQANFYSSQAVDMFRSDQALYQQAYEANQVRAGREIGEIELDLDRLRFLNSELKRGLNDE